MFNWVNLYKPPWKCVFLILQYLHGWLNFDYATQDHCRRLWSVHYGLASRILWLSPSIIINSSERENKDSIEKRWEDNTIETDLAVLAGCLSLLFFLTLRKKDHKRKNSRWYLFIASVRSLIPNEINCVRWFAVKRTFRLILQSAPPIVGRAKKLFVISFKWEHLFYSARQCPKTNREKV